MAYQMKDGQGSLFKNSFKKQDNHPDMTGECLIDGVTYQLAGWSKVTSKGDKFLSLSIKPKGDSRSSRDQAPERGDLDDGIPF